MNDVTEPCSPRVHQAEGFGDLAPPGSSQHSSSSSNAQPDARPAVGRPPIELAIQLSSPVEEATLSRLYDPQDAGGPGSTRTFRGVETGQATLTVVGIVRAPSDADNKGGDEGEGGGHGADANKGAAAVAATTVATATGASLHDLGPILKFDAMDPDAKVVEATVVSRLLAVAVAAAADDDDQTADAAPTKASDEQEASTDEPDAAAASDEEKVLGTVTLRLTFRPSAQDRREELYEILNRATQRKAAAVERLRSAAVAEQRRLQQQHQHQQSSSSSSPGKTMVTRSGAASPAVRAGFLNKPSRENEKKPWKVRVLYDKYLGPNSLARQVFPIARNYLTFAVAVYFMHTKGQLLALPAPV